MPTSGRIVLNSDHHIIGLTPETHATYCRDALAAVLKACPQITGLTLRIHGESGIPEGSYPFWQTLFEAISGAGRVIEIDMHAKGLNQIMIDMAHKTGMPVKAGAKFWAEHQGLGYHQADIRETEYPRKGVTGTFAVSSGERNFTRYGYGDFYGQRSDIEVLYRVWPGTQRHLLWGDAALASGYGRAANFCGAAGMELCEPLTFKGREGSGHPGGRNSYADPSLANVNHDTNKFAITYLLWGRYLYNPDTSVRGAASIFPPGVWLIGYLRWRLHSRVRVASCHSSLPRGCRRPPTTASGRSCTVRSQSFRPLVSRSIATRLRRTM